MALCAASQVQCQAAVAVCRHACTETSSKCKASPSIVSSQFLSGSRLSANRTHSVPLASRRKQTTVTSAELNAPAASIENSGKEIVPDNEISITKTSFGSIGLIVGSFLLSYGFGAYFTLLPGTDFSAIMLTYGFPLALIGFALKYAELKPVSCLSYADAVALREKQATTILAQVRSDVTRFRYGDEQHLEEALKRIFRYGLSGGISRRIAPQLESIMEEVHDGRYCLVLKFDAPKLTLEDFKSREPKFTSFFGPGVTAIVGEGGTGKYNVQLVSNGDAQTA